MRKMMTNNNYARQFRVNKRTIEYLRSNCTETTNRRRDKYKFEELFQEMLELITEDVEQRKAKAEKHLKDEFPWLIEKDFEHYCLEIKSQLDKDDSIGVQFAIAESIRDEIKRVFNKYGFKKKLRFKEFIEYAALLRMRKYGE